MIIASNSECYIFQNCNLLQMGVQTCYRRCISGLTIWPRGLLVLPAAPWPLPAPQCFLCSATYYPSALFQENSVCPYAPWLDSSLCVLSHNSVFPWDVVMGQTSKSTVICSVSSFRLRSPLLKGKGVTGFQLGRISLPCRMRHSAVDMHFILVRRSSCSLGSSTSRFYWLLNVCIPV